MHPAYKAEHVVALERGAIVSASLRHADAGDTTLMRARAELVERSFAHCLDRGGMRRVWLRGLENIEKRSLIHVSGFNLGVLMCTLFSVSTLWRPEA